MKGLVRLSAVIARHLPEPEERVGCLIMGALLIWLLLTQMAAIHSTLNGISAVEDPYSEANAIRAAQHYAEKGFLTDAGLPHVTYGDRFPLDGWVKDLDRSPLPSGVYTRYPPVPDLICGVLEKLVGFDHLWTWRLLPVGFGLSTMIYAFFSFKNSFGPVASGVMTTLLFAVPMATSYMHGLHYQGYAHSMFLVQLCFLVRIFFARSAPRFGSYAALFGFGFVQGWLSFEYAFIVMGAAIPIALIARANGYDGSVRPTLFLVVSSGAGFTIAHILHFLQVASFYGSVAMALQDYLGRAAYRLVGEGESSYLTLVLRVLRRYSVELWFSPHRGSFGFLLPFLSAAVLFDRVKAVSVAKEDWSKTRHYLAVLLDGKVVLPVILSYVFAALWLFAMPSMSMMHMHIVPRIFFLPYFVLVLIAAIRTLELLARVNWTHSTFSIQPNLMTNIATNAARTEACLPTYFHR